MSEVGTRVRGQAEPGGAAYVAMENYRTAEDRDFTVPRRLPPPETAQRHPSGAGDHGGGNRPGAGEQPFSSGSDTTGRRSSIVRRRPEGKGAAE